MPGPYGLAPRRPLQSSARTMEFAGFPGLYRTETEPTPSPMALGMCALKEPTSCEAVYSTPRTR